MAAATPRPACLYCPDMYQACKVVVLDLSPDTSTEDVKNYFDNIGVVDDVVMKRNSKYSYAFVRFTTQSAVECAMSVGKHMIRRHRVRVLRAFKQRIPARPFPCMDAEGSPLQSAVADLNFEASVLSPTLMWDAHDLSHVLALWS